MDRPENEDQRQPAEENHADPRRRREAWSLLAERQRDLCEALAHLAGAWSGVEVRDELELAVCVTDLGRRIDMLLGEFLCDVWWALLALRDVEPPPRHTTLERELSPDAHLVVVTAMAAARAAAKGGRAASWDGGDPAVRRRLDEIRAALQRIALGEPVPDPLLDDVGAPPAACWEPPGLPGPGCDAADASMRRVPELHLIR